LPKSDLKGKGLVKTPPKTTNKNLQDLLQKTTKIGAKEAKIINPKTVETAPWVRGPSAT